MMSFSVLFLEPEIATPPLTGIILPGVTRSSLLEIGKTWVSEGTTGTTCDGDSDGVRMRVMVCDIVSTQGTHKVVERIITMKDVKTAVQEGRVSVK